MTDDRPTTCPRCGSTDPGVRHRPITPHTDRFAAECPDPWHFPDRPTTDDLPARLVRHHDGTATSREGLELRADLRRAAARIRELEAAGDALKDAVEGYGYADPGKKIPDALDRWDALR